MTKTIDTLVKETLHILNDLGIPMSDLTQRRKLMMAKSILALLDIKVNNSWSNSKSLKNKHACRSREIIKYINKNLGEEISEGSYDDIRRKHLSLPVEAGIVLKAALNKNASTNDGTRKFAINDQVIEVFRAYKTKDYSKILNNYLSNNKSLKDRLNRERTMSLLEVNFPDNKQINFSPGEHNELQKKVIEEFLPRFGGISEILYIGDTENKFKILEKEKLKELGFFEISHDKLPDILAYSKSKNWLFLIEAVYSSGPISEMRKLKLDELTQNLKCEIIYVTAFNNKDIFRKHIKDIAWETEVWIAENPSHLIHFNGDKFLGPYKKGAN